MITQNINGKYQNRLYANHIEKNNGDISQIPTNDEFANNKKGNTIKDALSISSSVTAPKTLATPTKIYVDRVINNAIENIAHGNNIEDNKRIIRLFSNLIRENPENMLRKAYSL